MAPENRPTELLIEEAEDKCGRLECQEAIELLEQAVRIQPGSPALYYQLGFCYGGCRQRHPLRAPEISAQYLRHALSMIGPSAQSLLRARILNALGNILPECHERTPAGRLRDAIACHQEAADIFEAHGLADDWAREEFNLANAWCDVSEPEYPEKWAEAIKGYRNALQVRTRSTDPRHHAATMLNLGTALRQLPSGSHAANVIKAVRCYQEALRIYSLAAFPLQYAEACNNLGNACLSFPSMNDASQTRHARQALRHFDRALRVWNRRVEPSRFALAQYNRGCAYLRLMATPQNRGRAAGCFSQAYECARASGQGQVAKLAEQSLNRLGSEEPVRG